jgi:hypothetical protein
MANEIVGFGVRIFFSLIILNEFRIKCVIGFGRFVKISKTIIFNI